MEIKRLSLNDCAMYQEQIIRFIFESVTLCAYEERFTYEDAVNKYNELRKYIEMEKAISCGAVKEKRLIGFVWAYDHPFRDDDNRLYISILHVEKESRGQGVGQQILCYLEYEARQRGYHAIYLHAEAFNENALKFYEKELYKTERIQLIKEIDGTDIIERYPGGGYMRLDAEQVIDNKHILAQMITENIRAHIFTESFTIEDGGRKIEELAKYISEGKALSYIFRDKYKIAGFTWIYPYNYRNNQRYYIGVIQVSEGYRGRGIAPVLYCCAMKRILEKGVHIIYTHVDARNMASISMHHKCGFKDEQYQLVKYL